MLSAKFRLKKQFFPLVLKQNKAFSGDYLTLRVHRRLEIETNFKKVSNWAVVISNKVIPHSVDRHLIKRRIHAILEKLLAQIPDNLDIIIQINKNPLKLSFLELENELVVALKDAKLK